MAAQRRENDDLPGIKSIDVAFRVLAAMERGRGPLSLSEIAREADMHPAKAHRYLASLVRTGLAAQDSARGLYDLGPAARQLGVEALRRLDPVRTAGSYAFELRDKTGHTVNLSVWSDTGPTMVGWDTGAHPLPMVIRVGSTLPMLDSAVGHVFLGHLPQSITDPVIKLQQREGATRQMPAAEIEVLRERSRGARFSGIESPMLIGLAALAAPVFGAGDGIELALGIVLPERQLNKRLAKQLSSALCATADELSAALGHGR